MKIIKYITIILLVILAITIISKERVEPHQVHISNESTKLITINQKIKESNPRIIIINNLYGKLSIKKNSRIYIKEGYFIANNKIFPPRSSLRISQEEYLYNYKVPSKGVLITMKNE